MKLCTKCKQNKDETCFGKRAARKDGLDSRCKECRSKYDKERTIKRNKKRKEETLPDGMKRCANSCNKILPLSEFESTKERRTDPTTTCTTCRAIHKKSEQNPTSAKGKCKEWWQNWQKTNPCQYEGGCEHPDDWRLIHADVHVDPKAKKRKRTGESGHRLSHYTWWAYNGGVEAMEEEAKKCQPLCIFHHRIKTKKERQDQTEKNKVEKRARINEKKRERGECLKCEMKCVQGNEFLFDLDHRDPEKKTIGVSTVG